MENETTLRAKFDQAIKAGDTLEASRCRWTLRLEHGVVIAGDKMMTEPRTATGRAA